MKCLHYAYIFISLPLRNSSSILAHKALTSQDRWSFSLVQEVLTSCIITHGVWGAFFCKAERCCDSQTMGDRVTELTWQQWKPGRVLWKAVLFHLPVSFLGTHLSKSSTEKKSKYLAFIVVHIPRSLRHETCSIKLKQYSGSFPEDFLIR